MVRVDVGPCVAVGLMTVFVGRQRLHTERGTPRRRLCRKLWAVHHLLCLCKKVLSS